MINAAKDKHPPMRNKMKIFQLNFFSIGKEMSKSENEKNDDEMAKCLFAHLFTYPHRIINEEEEEEESKSNRSNFVLDESTKDEKEKESIELSNSSSFCLSFRRCVK